MDVQTHYKTHLSQFYTWMFGNFDEMVMNQKTFFSKFNVLPFSSKVAIDLGSGSGFQTLALKQMGFKVHAVDTSEELLQELKAKDPQAETHLRDLRDLSFAQSLSSELIVCMGDTLTHLSELEEVVTLMKDSHSILCPKGKLIFTFRDLTHVPQDIDRFIPVKSDETRILTCFLEDKIEKVKVSDLLYEKSEGKWNLEKSSYLKLKIKADWLKSEMIKIGFTVELSKLPNGMEVVIGTR